jgi:ubiquinone/menaquinone biosynthesis C-methylase UbiE
MREAGELDKNHMRFENPARLAELKPSETLLKIGLDGSGVVCDIGAGSGIFSLAAAAITEGMVYAVEISEEMLQVLRDKIAESGVRNIRLIRSEDDRLPIEGRSVDYRPDGDRAP